MKFILTESYKPVYTDGWAEEDKEIYEAIDWDLQGDSDFDSGFAYIDTAVFFSNTGAEYVKTEFHKFFAKDTGKLPYYRPIDAYPFESEEKYIGPVSKGDKHKNYDVYNQYDLVV